MSRRTLCIHRTHHSIGFSARELTVLLSILQANARPSALLPNGGDWQLAHECGITPKLIRDLVKRLTQRNRDDLAQCRERIGAMLARILLGRSPIALDPIQLAVELGEEEAQ
eukprot:5669544-Prymnesium_polylepis.1